MTLLEAKEILREMGVLRDSGYLIDPEMKKIFYALDKDYVRLINGYFSVKQLEAILVYMKACNEKGITE